MFNTTTKDFFFNVLVVFFFFILFIYLLDEISITIEAFSSLKDMSNPETQKLLSEMKILEEQHLAKLEKLNEISKTNNDLLSQSIETNTIKMDENIEKVNRYNKQDIVLNYVLFGGLLWSIIYLL